MDQGDPISPGGFIGKLLVLVTYCEKKFKKVYVLEKADIYFLFLLCYTVLKRSDPYL